MASRSQKKERQKTKWNLNDSQQQLVVQMHQRHESEIQMIKNHQAREMSIYISTLRGELKIPEKMPLGLERATSPMFIRKLTEEEMKPKQSPNGEPKANG